MILHLLLVLFSNMIVSCEQNFSINMNLLGNKRNYKLKNNMIGYNNQFKSQLRRRFYPAHPSISMRIGETRIFSVKPQCRLREREFIVLKSFKEAEVDSEDSDDDLPSYFYFYAVSGASVGFTELEGGTEQLDGHKYERQVAYIKCSHGWISHLNVFERILGTTHGQFGAENPRGCGIGVVLTELCLIDPEISTMKVDKSNKKGNKAMMILKQDMRPLVQENCYKVVGLSMAAVPPSDGHVYFSAANNMKYDYLIVDLTMGSNVQHAIYETKEAKRNFKSNGDIDACCGNNKCSVYSKSWFFCGSLNPFYSKFDELKPY